jgi:hypothetical protein
MAFRGDRVGFPPGQVQRDFAYHGIADSRGGLGPRPVAGGADRRESPLLEPRCCQHSAQFGQIHFFGHTASAPVQRVPFAEQQRAMQQFSRQPAAATLARSTAAGPAASGAWRSATSPASPGAGQTRSAAPAAGAWRPANQPSQAAGSSADRSSGWQRFGEPRPSGSYAPRPAYSQPGGSGYRPYATPTASSSGGGQQSIRVAPPVVREKSSQGNGTRSTSRSQPSAHSSAGTAHASGGGSHGGGGHR